MGSNGSQAVKEGIERQAVLGKLSEEISFDAADDGLGHITDVEQKLIGYGEWQGFHVLANAGKEEAISHVQTRWTNTAKLPILAFRLFCCGNQQRSSWFRRWPYCLRRRMPTISRAVVIIVRDGQVTFEKGLRLC